MIKVKDGQRIRELCRYFKQITCHLSSIEKAIECMVFFETMHLFFWQKEAKTMKKIHIAQDLHSIAGQPADKLRHGRLFLSK